MTARVEQSAAAATEFELKFQVAEHQRAAVEAAVVRGRSRRTRLQATYYDTADGALAAHGVVLRLRKEGKLWVQTAKGPADGTLERHEHNVVLGALPAAQQPAPQLDRHAGTAVGDLIGKALAKSEPEVKDAALVPLYRTDVRRITREMRTGDARVELAFDQGEVRADANSHPICELEIELKQGSPQSMLVLAQRWRSRYGLWLDTVAKSSRGERLARGESYGQATRASPPRYETDPSGPGVFRSVLGTCLAQILPNAAELAAGSPEAEHVHQLRVGIRRLRTALRDMADFAPPLDPGWEAALVEAFRALGRQRDQDHLKHTVQPGMAKVGGPPVAWDDIRAELAPPEAIVKVGAFQTALLAFIAASLPDESDSGQSLPHDPVRKALRSRLSKLHRQVTRDGSRFDSLDVAEQHRVRKRLKRLRYLAEFVAPLFDKHDVKRFLKRLGPAQDALGAHNDAAGAIQAYRELAEHEGPAWFAVGWLSARQPHSAGACRSALARVADAKPFWKSPAKR